VPQRLRAVLLRGLRSDPHERYPSMEALLDDLAPPRAGAGRPWLAVGGGLVIVVAVSFAFGYAKLGWFGGGEAREACPSARPQLDGVWDDATKASLRAAVLASNRDYAAASWDIFESDLDSYAGDWVDMHRAACEATLVRGEQSPELLDLRMACLAQRRDELAALTASLASVDDDGLRRMNSAARTLTPLSICANREELTAPVPLPQHARAGRADSPRARECKQPRPPRQVRRGARRHQRDS
jgi:hypothetical protein